VSVVEGGARYSKITLIQKFLKPPLVAHRFKAELLTMQHSSLEMIGTAAFPHLHTAAE